MSAPAPNAIPSRGTIREGFVERAFEVLPGTPTYEQLCGAYLSFSGRARSVSALVEFAMTFSQMSYNARIQAIHNNKRHRGPDTFRLRPPDEMVQLTLYVITQAASAHDDTFYEHYMAIETRLTPVKYAGLVREALEVDFEASELHRTGLAGRHAVEVEEVGRPGTHEHASPHFA